MLVFVMDLLEHFPLYPVVIYFVDNAFLPGRELKINKKSNIKRWCLA